MEVTILKRLFGTKLSFKQLILLRTTVFLVFYSRRPIAVNHALNVVLFSKFVTGTNVSTS